MTGKVSDGSTASYYELPEGATELQHLIAYKDMNAQMGEIFRANYRYGEVAHSDRLREINKILYYAQAEKDRLLKYELPRMAKKLEGVEKYLEPPAEVASAISSESTGSKSTYAERAVEEARRKRELAASDSGTYEDEKIRSAVSARGTADASKYGEGLFTNSKLKEF